AHYTADHKSSLLHTFTPFYMHTCTPTHFLTTIFRRSVHSPISEYPYHVLRYTLRYSGMLCAHFHTLRALQLPPKQTWIVGKSAHAHTHTHTHTHTQTHERTHSTTHTH